MVEDRSDHFRPTAPVPHSITRYTHRTVTRITGVTNRVQELLGVEFPVVQDLMTYIAGAELAAAVSDGGGLGVIETLTAEGRAMRTSRTRSSWPMTRGRCCSKRPGNPTMRVLRTGLAARIQRARRRCAAARADHRRVLRGRSGSQRGQHRSGVARITDLRPVADIVRRSGATSTPCWTKRGCGSVER